MEFWGVEIKPGEKLKVKPGENRLLHLSQACLGESKKKGAESVPLFLSIGNHRKLVLGHLSTEHCPHLSFDLVFEKKFVLSHNWKNGSVYFSGYKNIIEEDDDDEEEDYQGFFDEETLLKAAENGKLKTKAGKAEPSGAKEAAAKPKAEVETSEDSEDDSDDEDDSDEEMADANAKADADGTDDSEEDDEDDDDDDDDDSEEDEETPTPKKSVGKKMKGPAESAAKTPVPAKKAKEATPQKKDGKNKGGHTATPHPVKQASKTPSGDKTKSPKSGGDVTCKSCSRSFKSEQAMEAHSKAKHSGK